MLITEFLDNLSFVRWTVVDKEQHAFPAMQYQQEESDEVSLSFFLGKYVHEASLASCAKHVGADVLMIDEYRRVAAASSPAACDNGNQAESCFVLRGDDETALFVFAHQASRFFLNLAISSSEARKWCCLRGRNNANPN